MSTKPVVQRALISTSDKTGLVEFAQQLAAMGIDIIATGGTAKLLRQSDLPIIEVASYTGFPEILGGRVKTLHPKIHGGLLGRRGLDDTEMESHAISPIDLLVVNLYPFQQTIAEADCTFPEAVEQIDIGGPTMLRAAAKNHDAVTVVVDPSDYPSIIAELKAHGHTNSETRRRLAYKTFTHTAHYDAAISQYFAQQLTDSTDTHFPDTFRPSFHKKFDCRYGENPHQAAAFYESTPPQAGSLAQASLLQGKPLSFNNLVDADAALACVRALNPEVAACVIVKHATPCGVAQSDQLVSAYQNAYATDATSAFGGIIAVNQTLDAPTATAITEQQFVEVILAPAVSDAALAILAQKKNCRVLQTGAPSIHHTHTLHSVSGGLLMQDSDQAVISASDLSVVTTRQPSDSELADLLFAWQVVRFVKSNAIVYAKDGMTLGIGSGQTSRVFSARIAVQKASDAGLSLDNTVLASDAFFPFADGIEVAAAAGIKAIIQPGGSKRDPEVIAAANQAGMAMVFTGTRHFRH